MAAGLLSAAAQSNVYSANVVGYVNLPLTEGFNLVANQMDLDLNGTNNTIVNVFSNNLPVNATIYSWNGTGFDISSFAKNKAGTLTNWTLNFTINPGQGFWLSIPTGAFGGSSSNVTVVGNVLQGALVNPHLPPAGGYSLLSSMPPIAGGITSNLNYQPQLNDTVYTWNGTGYNIASYAKNKAGTLTNWTPSEPQIAVGQGFWLNSGAGATWSNNFVVQ